MSFSSFFVSNTRKSALAKITVLIAFIAFIDWRTVKDIPLGFLYFVPMLVAGSALNRWQVAAVAGVCTFLAETFDEYPWGPNTGLARDILYFAAFSCMGFFVLEATWSRRLSADHVRQMESEVTARRDAEEQLEVLVESSPAAILTTSADGFVLRANDAAHRIFGISSGALSGRSIRGYLPALMNVPALGNNRRPMRATMQCQGRREDGGVFQADVWFSTYLTSAGPRLAAMVLDTSDELRMREESNLHQMLVGSRILVAAVSHEVRNVCGAIALVHENLSRTGVLADNKDFDTLGTLVQALERIAAMDLRQSASHAAGIDIHSLLDELGIVIDPSLRDDGVTIHWDLEDNLPLVWADRQSLMQVFLNLTNNSQRAMKPRSRKDLRIAARREGSGVVVRFTDTGGGVTHPERLFRPFQHEAESTGLGLYLSRAFMRSFRGDLRYERAPDGSTFVVELSPALGESEDERYEQPDTDSAGGRSQSFSREPKPASSNRI